MMSCRPRSEGTADLVFFRSGFKFKLNGPVAEPEYTDLKLRLIMLFKPNSHTPEDPRGLMHCEPSNLKPVALPTRPRQKQTPRSEPFLAAHVSTGANDGDLLYTPDPISTLRCMRRTLAKVSPRDEHPSARGPAAFSKVVIFLETQDLK